MSNLQDQKMSDIHRSIVNIGGSNNGVTDNKLHVCDGNGYSTGIQISKTDVDINCRRGELSRFVQKGKSASLIYQDMSFPNVSSSVDVSSERSKFIADFDKHSGARIHFTRDDFEFKIAIKSKYFDQVDDGNDEVVGYWERSYGTIRYYFVQNGVTSASLSLDESLYYLDPSPTSGGGAFDRSISGLVKSYGSPKGIRHPNAFVDFKLILSCDEGLSINISEDIQKIRDFEGYGYAYSSVSDLINGFSKVIYGYHKANFENFDITSTPSAYALRLYNPVLWNPATVDPSGACALFGREIAPNVDYRFYLIAQRNLMFIKL